jgi:hypothetical protein
MSSAQRQQNMKTIYNEFVKMRVLLNKELLAANRQGYLTNAQFKREINDEIRALNLLRTEINKLENNNVAVIRYGMDIQNKRIRKDILAADLKRYNSALQLATRRKKYNNGTRQVELNKKLRGRTGTPSVAALRRRLQVL